MTTARKTSVSVRTARAKRRRRKKIKRILHTVLLLLFMAAVCVGAGYLIYILRGGSFSALSEKYQTSKEFENTLISGAECRADTMAKNLCVVEGDVNLESASLEAGQTGVLFDLNDQKVLFSRGAYERVYPASITKIMTSMLAMKNCGMDEVVTITAEDLQLEEGSQVCGFQVGDRLTMNQLLHCLLVYSGNDAASAIARYVGGGSTEAFVDMMNSYAAQLGCTGTHFTNPHGLQDPNHYTTPYDIYLMLREALNYPLFSEISQLSSYSVEYTRADGSQMVTYLLATDHYLTGEANAPKDVTVLGGKTGTTSDAGNCLALLSQNAYGEPYVSIVMGAATKELLYQQMNSLLVNINS